MRRKRERVPKAAQRGPGTDPQADPGPDPQASPQLSAEVRLNRGDFLYYNWTLALERPILPFFMYSFALLVVASLLGLWPEGRVFALAALVPMLLYALWVTTSANSLWRRFPQLKQPRRYHFLEDAYFIRSALGEVSVAYRDLERVLESRRALYLLRKDGSADLLPKRDLPDEDALRELLTRKVKEIRSSSFL